MAGLLQDLRLYLGSLDVSLVATKFACDVAWDAKDATTFRTGTPVVSTPNMAKILRGGLETATWKVDGLFSAGSTGALPAPDDVHRAFVRENQPLVACPHGSAAGDVAYFGYVGQGKYIPIQGAPGDIAEYAAEGNFSGGVRRGYVLQPLTVVTGAGNGDPLLLDPVLEGQKVYAALVIPSCTGGGSITVSLESDSDGLMLTPDVQIEFGEQPTPGAWFEVAAGPITDTHWRASWLATLDPDEAFAAFIVIAIE